MCGGGQCNSGMLEVPDVTKSMERHHGPDEETRAALSACMDHASDLLSAARAVQAAGHSNVAYHLATLALEEIGRRELILVQAVADRSTVPPAWPTKHTYDHVKKLFWCFFGASFHSEKMTGQKLDEMDQLSRDIHFARLAGLYVDYSDDSLSVPRESITVRESQSLIDLATARLKLVENETFREHISPEELKLQEWFLRATEEPERMGQILSGASLAKLAEFRSTRVWVQWLKERFDRAEAEARATVEEELRRSSNLPAIGTKEKWKLRIRILSDSHSIRPKVLTSWNNKVDWIKLSAVSNKKKQLMVDFILQDNVPIQALWYFGWGLARHFVVALNIGTMGFWWWRLPEQIGRYYETIEDLDKGSSLVLDRSPILKIDWGENRVLTERDLDLTMACFVALPSPREREQHEAYNYYIGGLIFLSVNDVHWQCERTAFGNFFESLRAMMAEAGDWQRDEPFEASFLHFLDQLFPDLDERARFAELCRRFEAKDVEDKKVTLKEVSFIKLFCDAYFLRKVRPRALGANEAGSRNANAS